MGNKVDADGNPIPDEPGKEGPFPSTTPKHEKQLPSPAHQNNKEKQLQPSQHALKDNQKEKDTNKKKLPPRAASETFTGAKFNNSLTVDDFELLTVVGKGSFGKVMQVKKKDTGKIFAMKVLKKQQLVARKQVAHTQTERKVLEQIDHPFIVSLRFAFQTKDKLYMILDYFSGGELFHHLKNTGRFTEDRARFYTAQITLALECLHKNTIVYRDLKPENILLDEDGYIRLTDFGLSKESVSTNELTHTFCGTPEYLAPEVIHGAGYNQAVDWWSLGTLLYEMLTGLPPFYNENLHIMYERIIRAKLTFPNYLSEKSKSFLAQLLERNPKQRLGGSEGDADDVKKHPFFEGIDWGKMMKKQYKAPFVPHTEGKTDTSNIDDEFKQETPKDTPVIVSSLASRGSQITFEGFTYKPENEQLQHRSSAI